MKVSEVIKVLRGMPQDADVVVPECGRCGSTSHLYVAYVGGPDSGVRVYDGKSIGGHDIYHWCRDRDELLEGEIGKDCQMVTVA